MRSFRTSNISKRFGANHVLQSITLEFEPGTVTALVGDNGAGKSTFLKTLAGIHLPDSGNIILQELDITPLTAQAHRENGIEMAYQDLALAKQQDVVTNLFMGRETSHFAGILARKAMRKEAATRLERLGIHIPDLDRPVGLLSGGQQQAIAIARAVMFEPKVLLLDEPTAALAAREVETTLEFIRHQKSEGRIVVLVSHRLNDVFAVADRIVVLKRGEVFCSERTTEITLAEVVERIVS